MIRRRFVVAHAPAAVVAAERLRQAGGVRVGAAAAAASVSVGNDPGFSVIGLLIEGAVVGAGLGLAAAIAPAALGLHGLGAVALAGATGLGAGAFAAQFLRIDTPTLVGLGLGVGVVATAVPAFWGWTGLRFALAATALGATLAPLAVGAAAIYYSIDRNPPKAATP
jgi:hypothetical protein